MKIEDIIDGKVETRDGRAVRIYTTTARCAEYPIIGSCVTGDGEERPLRWSKEGNYYVRGIPSSLDLVPIDKPSQWMNIYSDGSTSGCYNSKGFADLLQKDCEKRIACVEFREGDGL